MINKQNLSRLIENLDYNNISLEIAWQIEIIIQLRQILGKDYTVLPEIPLEKKDIKKEIDIVVENTKTKEKTAIELKMPLHGAHPRRMSQAIVDIAFLENLKKRHGYSKGFFIMITNDAGFWQGTQQDDIYKYFRSKGKFPLNGPIQFPKFFDEVDTKITIEQEYKINWKPIKQNDNYHYFILEI